MRSARGQMVGFGIIAICAGAVLSLRYKVLILVPASLAAGALVFLATIDAWPPTSSAFLLALAVAELQLGYIGGLAARQAIAQTRRHTRMRGPRAGN